MTAVQIRHLQPGAKRERKRAGRPSEFRKEFCEQARRYALLGATDRQMAEFFNVSEQTLNTWKHKHPAFLESLKAGKHEADAQVSMSLFKRATGCSHKATKLFNHDGQIIEHEYTEHYPPDTTAAIFFLKNRRPDLWRDKAQLEHGGVDGAPIRVQDCPALSDAELLAILTKGKPA